MIIRSMYSFHSSSRTCANQRGKNCDFFNNNNNNPMIFQFNIDPINGIDHRQYFYTFLEILLSFTEIFDKKKLKIILGEFLILKREREINAAAMQ